MRIFCSICKDIFIPYSEVLVTNCGHLYHNSCISTWIGRHKTCPQCRTNLSKPFRVYFDVDKDNVADASTLEHELETVSDKLREAERHKRDLLEENKNFEKMLEGMKECTISLSKKNDVLKTSVKALKEQVAKLSKKTEVITELESEINTWKEKVNTFERVDRLIKGSVEEVNKMIEDTPVTGLAVKQLCTYVGILKLQLHKLEDRNCRLVKENRDLNRKVSDEKTKYSCDSEELKNLKSNNIKLENELFHLKTLLKDYKKRQPEKSEEMASAVSKTTEMKNPTKKPSFDLDLDLIDVENETVGFRTPVQSDRVINQWEEMVCAGPSKNFGLSFMKFKSHNNSLYNHKEDKEVIRFQQSYAFDGFGGRKKLRLGGPTPLEEFEKMKKKKEKKTPAPAVQHKKIIEYWQVNGEI